MALRAGLNRLARVAANGSLVKGQSLLQPAAFAQPAACRIFSSEAELAEASFDQQPRKLGWGETSCGDVLLNKEHKHGAWLWCGMDSTVAEAVTKMAKARVGSLLVFDVTKLSIPSGSQESLGETDEDAVAGIVTERDYLTKIFVKGKKSEETLVEEIMTPKASMQTCTPKHSVHHAMSLMVEQGFRHVPVVDPAQGAYMGMLSMRDVMVTLNAEHHEETDRLKDYIQGGY